MFIPRWRPAGHDDWCEKPHGPAHPAWGHGDQGTALPWGPLHPHVTPTMGPLDPHGPMTLPALPMALERGSRRDTGVFHPPVVPQRGMSKIIGLDAELDSARAAS